MEKDLIEVYEERVKELKEHYSNMLELVHSHANLLAQVLNKTMGPDEIKQMENLEEYADDPGITGGMLEG